MRHLLLPLLLTSLLTSLLTDLLSAADNKGVDLMVFGASHHSNREFPWREFNPGAGFAPFYAFNDHIEAFIAVGLYQNSTASGSLLQMGGLRLIGNVGDDWQYGITAGYGVLLGYADNPARPLGGVFAGWRMLTLEATAWPPTDGTEDVPGTAVVACWLRVRVLRF